MTKRSQRRPARYEQSSCMWGFISMLDFRHATRSNRKMLVADERRGTHLTLDESASKIKLPTNVKESTITSRAISDASKTSVKALIEEEMVNKRDTDVKEQEPGQEDQRKNKYRKRSKRYSISRESFDFDCNGSSNAAERLNSECPCNHKNDRGSENHHNVDAIMEVEFCSHIYEKSGSCGNHSDGNKEKLQEAIKEFISQDNRGVNNIPQELVNVLHISNSDEESFQKVIGDPNSLLLKYVQSLKEAHLSKQKDVQVKEYEHERIVSKKQMKFFRRNVKNQEMTKENNGARASKTIVILKPRNSSPNRVSGSEHVEKESSHFFFSDIKRRWKNVIGKEQPSTVPSTARNGEKVETFGKKSPSKDHFYIEKITRSIREEKILKPNDVEGVESPSSSKRSVPNIYLEAKKNLPKMLSGGIEEADSSDRRSQDTLARILALSEFNSPVPSPRRDPERSFITAKLRFSDHKDAAEENDEGMEMEGGVDGTLEMKPNMSVESLSDSEVEKSLHSCRDEMSSGGDLEDLRTIEIVEEVCITSCSTELSDERNHLCYTLDQNEHLEQPEEMQHHEDELQKNADLERAADKPEQPSPVSVLEPMFMEEEDISPERSISESDLFSVELPIQPLQIKFEEEPNFSKPCREEETSVVYIKAVVEACGLNWDELYMKSQSSDQLLDSSLFNQVGLSCDHNHTATKYDDRMLLFDGINEVVLEVCGHDYGNTTNIRVVPNMENAVNDILERVQRYLVDLSPLHRTLDRVIRRDMSKSWSWMDLRLDTEEIGVELGDDILDDIIEDATSTLMDGNDCGVDP